MSNGLYRLGRWIAAHHRLVLVAWVVAVLGLVGLNRVAGGDAVDDFRVPGVESQAAVDLLEQRFPERAGATAMVVFHVDDGTVNDPATAAAIDATITEVASLEHVLAVTDPLAGASTCWTTTCRRSTTRSSGRRCSPSSNCASTSWANRAKP